MNFISRVVSRANGARQVRARSGTPTMVSDWVNHRIATARGEKNRDVFAMRTRPYYTLTTYVSHCTVLPQ
jgi:hypothetical protein